MRLNARMLVVLLMLTAIPADGQAPTGLVTISYKSFARCGRIVLRRANRLDPTQYTRLTPRNNGIYLLFAISQIQNDSVGPFTFRADRLFVPAGDQSRNIATDLGDPIPPQIVAVSPHSNRRYTGWVVMEYSKPGYTARQLLHGLGGMNVVNSLRYRTRPGESPVLMAYAGTSSLTIREECSGIDLRDRSWRLY
jgi:hypothetical protein